MCKESINLESIACLANKVEPSSHIKINDIELDFKIDIKNLLFQELYLDLSKCKLLNEILDRSYYILDIEKEKVTIPKQSIIG